MNSLDFWVFKNDDIAQLLHLLCIALMFLQYRTRVDVGALVDQATNHSATAKVAYATDVS